MPDTEVVGHIDLTPTFNYHREYEIVKRFLEQLTKLSGDEHLGSDAIKYVRQNLPYVRDAMGLVLSDDVERQIQLTKDFPLRPQLFLHKFVAEQQIPGATSAPHCTEDDCYALGNAMVHTL